MLLYCLFWWLIINVWYA